MNLVNEPSGKGTTDSVSVVVPSYNHAGFVRQTLRSIFKQTFPPLELIVIDDGSKDDSVRMISETLKDCPFPSELYVRSNKGLCRTLIEGLERSRGTYFAYLGSDDVWLPKLLEVRIAGLRENPSAPLAFGHCYKINEQNEIGGDSRYFERYEYPTTRDMLLYGYPPFSPTVVYRREALASDCWDPGIGLEDYDLYLRLCVKGEFAFDSHTLSAWRAHGNNTSRNLEFMAAEVNSALQRNASALGLSSKELRNVQKRMRLRHVDNYILDGRRWLALRTYLESVGGAPSKGRMVKLGMKVVSPSPLYDLLTRVRRRPESTAGKLQAISEDFEVVEI